MTNLQKIVCTLLLILCGSACFAKSDLQFHLGYMILDARTDYAHQYEKYVLELSGEDDDDYRGITARLENYNLFDINKVVSIGFFENAMYGYLNDCWTLEFMVGPAVGLQFFNWLKFQLSIGADAGYRHAEKDLGTPYIPTVGYTKIGTRKDGNYMLGFASDIQAKFFPDNKISPVGGVRYAWAYAKIFDNDTYTNAVEFYAGISYNFY